MIVLTGFVMGFSKCWGNSWLACLGFTFAFLLVTQGVHVCTFLLCFFPKYFQNNTWPLACREVSVCLHPTELPFAWVVSHQCFVIHNLQLLLIWGCLWRGWDGDADKQQPVLTVQMLQGEVFASGGVLVVRWYLLGPYLTASGVHFLHELSYPSNGD